MTPLSLSTVSTTDQPGPRQCLARTRNGGACQKLALKQKARCRLHGGLSPGAPKGALNGNYSSGRYTAKAIAERKRKTASRRRSFRRIKLAAKMCELLGLFGENTDQDAMFQKNRTKLEALRLQLEALDEPGFETL
jgi:hypothetical protein